MRFQVGELARFVVPSHSEGVKYVGSICEITHIAPSLGDIIDFRGRIHFIVKKTDYLASFPSNGNWLSNCQDWQLQKLDPPAEPESITRREECEV